MQKTNLLFFVAEFIVLRKNLNELQSFKHNTHCFVSTTSEIWFRTILYKSAESNPLLYLILAVDRLHSTAHAETELLWIHIPFIIKHPIIQCLIFHLNWELHHQYLYLFQHTDKIITHWRLKNPFRVSQEAQVLSNNFLSIITIGTCNLICPKFISAMLILYYPG